MKIISVLLLALLYLAACKDPQAKTDATTKKTTRLFVTDSYADTWMHEDSAVEKLKLRFKTGYTEDFSINDRAFRFQLHAGSNDQYDLLVKKNDNWLTNLTLPMPRSYQKFYLTSDFDLDQYFDLSYTDYGDVVIHFFDKDTKQFAPESIRFPYDCALLDKDKLIYGSNDKRSGTWNIDIFSLAGRKMYHYLAVKINQVYDNKLHKDFFTDALLYRCREGVFADTTRIDTLHIRQPWGEFNLNGFMKTLVKRRL